MKVYELINSEEKQYVIISQDSEKMNLCETYGKYGQKYDCYECGCYALENQSSNIEIAEEILKKAGIDVKTVLDEFNCEYLSEIEMFDFVDFVESNLELQKIREEIEIHIECEGFSYWDGSNWKSLIVTIEDDPWETDLREVSEELEKAILKAFEEVDTYIEGINKEVVVDNFKFYMSRMQGFFYEAIIEEA